MQKTHVLKPISVGDFYPVRPKKDGKLKGYCITVVYDGVAKTCKDGIHHMGLLSGGCGSKQTVITDREANQTKVEYFFRENFFFPKSVERVTKFKKNIEGMKDLRVLDVSDVCFYYFSPRLGQWFVDKPIGNDYIVGGYSVTVSYAGSDTAKNPFFATYAMQEGPRVSLIKNDKKTNRTLVVYVFRSDEIAIEDGYHNASMFQSCMVGRKIRDNNVK